MFDLQILDAEKDGQTQQVVALLRDYFLWLSRRYVAEMPILDAHYDNDERERELADLCGRYGAPRGGILLARVNGIAAGCVMFRPLEPGACEMKRLFVRPAFQGKGIARALVCKLAQLAVERGYGTIRLETGPRQFEAQALYRAIGFLKITPYYDVSGWFADNMVFLEADAGAVACEHNLRKARDVLPTAA